MALIVKAETLVSYLSFVTVVYVFPFQFQNFSNKNPIVKL